MKVSLIIPVYRRPYLLNLGLFSLSLQKTNHEIETIIINDGIIDDTENICKKYPNLNIKYFFTGQRNYPKPIRRCPCVANNIGVKRASGDIIVLTCPEILHMTQNNLNNLIQPFVENNTKIITKFKGVHFDLQNEVKYDNFSEYCSKLPFCIAMKKTIFMDIGGYDEDFIGYAGEDDNLIYRLENYGCKYVTVDGIIVHLWHGGSFIPIEELNNNKEHQYNKKLLEDRKNDIYANQNKEWGNL